MLSCGKVIGHLSRISRNVQPNCVKQTSKFIELTSLRYTSSKKVNKTGVTLRPEECTPQQSKEPASPPPSECPPQSNLSETKCGIKSSEKSLPPMCEEICGPLRPPNGSSSSEPPNSQTSWKKILAGLIIAGVTVTTLAKFDYFQDTITNSKPKKKAEKKSKTRVKSPETSAAIPSEVPYLLIGGGTASFSAFRSIKSKDPKAKVLVISDEPDYPYMRPPLSKELWYNRERVPSPELTFKQWNGTERSLYYEPKQFYSPVEDLMSSDKGGVAVASGWKVQEIDVHNKTAILEDGYEIKYDKCLIATGASPITLPVFERATEEVKSKVLTFRSKEDFLELESRLADPSVNNIVIVGGGFLGSELACTLAKTLERLKKNVYQVYKEKFIMSQVLPEYLSEWTTKRAALEGVISVPNANIDNAEIKDGQLQLHLTNGKTLKADQVIVAVGVNVNTELATHSGLEVEPNIGGYLVNAELQARRDLWVAGDAACFYDVRLGRRRVEHHDHAVISGRLAGENMTGAGKPYLHQSMFWSDLGPQVGYEAVGIIDSSLPTFGIFAKTEGAQSGATSAESPAEHTMSSMKPVLMSQTFQNDAEDSAKLPQSGDKGDDYGKGLIFYLRDDVVVGIVLWNIFNRMSIARQVLTRGTHLEELSEIAKLFSIHED